MNKTLTIELALGLSIILAILIALLVYVWRAWVEIRRGSQ